MASFRFIEQINALAEKDRIQTMGSANFLFCHSIAGIKSTRREPFFGHNELATESEGDLKSDRGSLMFVICESGPLYVNLSGTLSLGFPEPLSGLPQSGADL